MRLAKLLLKFSKYAKYGLLLQTILCIFWSLKEALFPYFIKNIVNTLTAEPSINSIFFIYVQIGLLISVWAFMEIAMRLQGYIASKIFPSLRGKIREYIFEKLSHRTLEYKQSVLSGDLASKVSELPKAVEQVFEIIYLHIPSIGCAFLIGAFLLFKVSPLFGIIAIGWAVLHLLLSVIFAKYCVRNTYLHAKSETALAGKIVDMISNRLTSHLYTTSTMQLENLRKNQSNEVYMASKARMAIELPKFFQSALSIVFMSTMLFLLVVLWQKKKVTVGDFALVPMLSYSIVGMITWFSYLINIFLKQIGFIKASAEIQELPNTQLKNNTEIFNIACHKIVLSHVSYKYYPSDILLNNISLTINSAEKIAIIGPSGVGKSTLLKIIAGVLKDYTGIICIDGKDLQKLPENILTEYITLIPQTPELFNTTIFENIILGQSDIKMNKVIDVAKLAEAHEFILDLPDGYETIVDERGYNLSVGQAQRIILARALLRNKKILILDESTSALDASTEDKIFSNIKTHLIDKTVIIATHHTRTLRHFDRVLLLENGNIKGHESETANKRELDQVVT